MSHTLTAKLSARLKSLRKEQGWTLDQLGDRSGVSKATLSRLENGDVSPTTEVLGKLCAAYGVSLTRLISMVEEEFPPLVQYDQQVEWADPKNGFRRRSVSPPAGSLAAEILEGRLDPGACLAYERPPVAGQEHHLIMQEGTLQLTVDGHKYDLKAGDCLRYQLFGASSFQGGNTEGARYLLVLV